MRNKIFILAVIILSFIATIGSDAQLASINTQTPVPQATPSNKFTAADIAKLKWIEGTWRGMDGDKPFYERYKLEETALVVEGLKADGSPDAAAIHCRVCGAYLSDAESNESPPLAWVLRSARI